MPYPDDYSPDWCLAEYRWNSVAAVYCTLPKFPPHDAHKAHDAAHRYLFAWHSSSRQVLDEASNPPAADSGSAHR